MKQQNYHHTITANVPAKEAMDKICRVPDWWTKGFTGQSKKRGDKFTVRWGETFVDFEITEIVPDKKIVWQVTHSDITWLKDRKEWNNTNVVFEISSKNGNTKIKMTHNGLVPGVECYDECNVGWNFYIGESLLKLLTDNKGLPDRQRSSA